MPRIDKTKMCSPEQRKFDTLAKFLTGNSVVCAVILDTTQQPPKLLISTNSMTKKDAMKLKSLSQESFTAEKRESVSEKTRELLTSLDFLKAIPELALNEAVTRIYNKTAQYFGTQKLEMYNSAKSSTTIPALDMSKIDEAITQSESFSEDVREFARQQIRVLRKLEDGDFQEAVHFFLTHKADLVEKGWGKGGIPISFFKQLENLDQTLLHDSRKLAEVLITGKYPVLKNSLLEGNFEFIGPSEDKPFRERQDFHAERNLIDFLIENGKFGSWYIGINKLCCFGCANDVALINQYSEKLHILTRGSHNVQYPRLDLTDLHRIVDGLDDAAYVMVKKHFSSLPESVIAKTIESANLSDSEVEVEFTGVSY